MKRLIFSMRWLRGPRQRSGVTSEITYVSVDDLVLWTYQLEQLNGSSEGLEQLRKLIARYRSTHSIRVG